MMHRFSKISLYLEKYTLRCNVQGEVGGRHREQRSDECIDTKFNLL